MADKPKIGICWLGGCGGCDEAVVDLHEDILKVTNAFDIILWPVALDYKYHHIEAMKDGEITLSIINGSVRNSEHEEVAHLLEEKITARAGLRRLRLSRRYAGHGKPDNERGHLPVGLCRLPHGRQSGKERAADHDEEEWFPADPS